MVENRIDPKGMIALFNHLQSGDDNIKTPEFLSTHPDIKNRIEALAEKLPDLQYQVSANPELGKIWSKLKE
ncbi:hypothetical protein HMI54_014158 [Coelomomyces lativittatus]|nr:hypothetical protein HMI54_014158 [Coelomomyces lativittatus]